MLGIIVVIELCTCSAMGVMISCQAGIVASSHWERLHARAPAPVDGNSVAGSSHRSASRTASSTARPWASATTGSPAVAIALRATSVAADQFTAPVSGLFDIPCSIAPSWDSAEPRSPMLKGFCGWPLSSGSEGVKPKGTLLMGSAFLSWAEVTTHGSSVGVQPPMCWRAVGRRRLLPRVRVR